MTPANKNLEQTLLTRLEHALIVSCQPVTNGPMDKVEHVVAMALAALAGGARGLRIEGVENVRAMAAVTDAPIIGIVKKDMPNSAVRISPRVEDIVALAEAGATIIAFDATDRPRPTPSAELLNALHQHGCIGMADCATYEEGKTMAALGCTFIGSTMSGYTDEGDTPIGPDLELIERWYAQGFKVIAEGRYNSPERAAQAIEVGALAVAVGSAITRVEHIAGWFADSIGNAAVKKPEGRT
ncbi:MAG: N-acetylmannosamine-6-phosphate 2-epimerase [Pseudomonadales bacterium]